MKTYKYIALAALALGFAACTQDDDFTPQQEDIVQIASVNIATEVQTRVNTLGDGTQWENNDQILLVNNSRDNKNSGIYTYNGTAWELTSGIVLYASGTNAFTAYYPAESEEEYNLPTDQSTEAGIMSADRMVATTTGVAKGAAVALSFERQHAKVTITPAFATQYEGKTIGDITDFKIDGITPYLPEGGNAYTAILAPAEDGFTVMLKVGQDELAAESSTKIEAGKHYTFSLTVGKEAVKITDVSVTKWTEKTISDVETDEILEASTEAEMVAALEKGGNIELTGDITVSDEYGEGYNVTKNTTIDLNGHTITGACVFDSKDDIVLTISGNGTIIGTQPNILYVIEGYLTLNILGGTIEGGTNILGTTVMSGGRVDVMNTNKNDSDDDTSYITDGYVENLNCWGGILKISGGHVKALGTVNGTIIISGGTFGFDPTEYLAEGCTATEADGIWTVAPSNN